jgi:quercetin dioxygenase-like cupin family protein
MRAVLAALAVTLSSVSGAFAGTDADADAAMGRRVQDLLRAHQHDVYGCVGAAGGAVRGEVLVRVVVGEGGVVARAEALKSDGDGGRVAACLVERVRGWSLSSLGAAAGDQIVFPLAFRPESAPPAVVEPLALAAREAKTIAHDGQLALFVVKGRVRVDGEALGPRDLAWLAPKQLTRLVADEPAVVVRVESPITVAALDRPLPPRFVVRAAQPKAWPIAGGRGTARLYLPTECNLAVDLLEAQAGVSIPPHRHDGSDEILYIINGRGTTTIAAAPRPTRAGDVLHIPAGVEHALTVDESIAAVQVYAPGGPEQRFTQRPQTRK